MKSPLISVIMPAYNAQRYIADSLDSILNQPCKDFEIIVVNDGSTDRTAEILNHYSNKYEQIIVLEQKNQGVSVARNKGLEVANGKYISFLDSDDLWACNFYNEKLHEIIQLQKSDMYAFDFFVANSKCKRGNIVGSRDRINEGDKFVFLWNHFASFMYSREMINKNKIKFSVGQKIDEDNAFLFLNLCVANEVYPVSKCGLIYRNNWNSVTYKIDNICKEKFSVVTFWKKLKTFINENASFYSKEAVDMCNIKISISVLDYINFAAKEGKSFEEINTQLGLISGDEIIKESVNLDISEFFESVRNEYLSDPEFFINKKKRSFLKNILNRLSFLKKMYIDYNSYSLIVEDYLKTQKDI